MKSPVYFSIFMGLCLWGLLLSLRAIFSNELWSLALAPLTGLSLFGAMYSKYVGWGRNETTID